MIFAAPEQVLGLALFAIVFDIVIGWPQFLIKSIGHPVMWIGNLVSFLEKNLINPATNTPYSPTLSYSPKGLFFRGALLSTLTISASVAVSILLSNVLSGSSLGFVLIVVCCGSLLATRSLHSHVQQIYLAFSASDDDLTSARHSLSNIVSRDTEHLDETAICQGAIESLTENTSDGVIAPLFWLLVLGLPGLVFYKAINTLDSMIGYRNERYEYFGKFAARLDDVVNWIPARITALLYWVVSTPTKWHRLTVIAHEARAHVSPNAGWPEAAAAIALNIRLGGERSYLGQTLMGHTINAHAPQPTRVSLAAALSLYRNLIGAVVTLLAVVFFLVNT